ncbi:MAG: TlyA family RNA methyltransferase [Kiritimatiellia bacterium]|jgi:23S rRNA (cytidine1920-2'-O)/16S rRNA (cytidine1409-2'-O)-methyltransferase|nr:TlyA family RNA methyltransferase [Kiritimatiellia bacterium]
MKERLDTLLVRAGLAESKERAQRLIWAGEVFAAGQLATKAGHKYPDDVALTVKAQPRFVSRGGEKLEGAFAAFSAFHVTGKVCLDVGASTGGFTDCLLQHGAARVIALDVGKGQLHWSLRQDPRVRVMESFNARYLRPTDLPEPPGIGVTDVSFISLKHILPPMSDVLPPGGEIVSLIKPQFEAGRGNVPGGVVRDPAVREAVVEEIRAFGTEMLHLDWLGCVPSPLLGPEGNVEYLAWWRKP